ncbi:MAG: AAA family ATPase [Bacteroidia bacterium]|nr:AAA family ATPase [Bacteroidia bacterium]
MSLNNDKPISDWAEDRLHRATFVKALAEEIDINKGQDCNVIGLYGKWGIGKTSLLSLLQIELEEKYFFTTYFNPWRYKDEDFMVRELFVRILEGARSDTKLKSKRRKLGEFLSKYGEYISIPKITTPGGFGVDASDTAKGIVKGAGELLQGNETIDTLKGKINEALRSLALPLVIFVDDVDRLDVSEIQSLFKLVKLTANFDNLIYVIAFDDEMVAKALSKSYGTGEISDGKSFLEKIVQLPLRIPYVNDFERFEYTLNLFTEWAAKNSLNLPEAYQITFLQSYRSLHDYFIKTPRDSKRLVNAVSFSYRCLKGEVNVYDIIVLETIRIFSPQVFEAIILYSDYLFSNRIDERGLQGFEMPKREDIQNGFRSRIGNYEFIMPILQDSIHFMFPLNDFFNKGKGIRRNEMIKEMAKNQRVGIRRYFDRFLEFKIGVQDISDSEFKEIFSEINNKEYDDITDKVKRFEAFPKGLILDRLKSYKDEMSEIGRANLAVLMTTNEYYWRGISWSDSFITRQFIEFALECISRLTEPSQRKKVLMDILHKSTRKHHTAELIYFFLNHNRFVFDPKSEIERQARTFIGKLQKKPIERLFENVDNEKNEVVFTLIKEYGNVKGLKKDLTDFVTNGDYNVLLFLKSMISMTYVNRSSIPEYRSDDIDIRHFQTIEEYVQRNILEEKIYNIYPDLRHNMPSGFLRGQNIETDKKIAVQYLRYVEHMENNSKWT